MDEISNAIELLRQAVCGSEIYQEYRRQEELLSRNPELEARVRQFRADNFRLQNEAPGGDLIQVSDAIYHESRQLRSDPQVNAYLDAELALCKLMQRIAQKLCDGIEFSTPDI